MDTTFLTLFRLMEKTRKAHDFNGEMYLSVELLRYGIKSGLLKNKQDIAEGEEESEESVLLRADASASLLRDFRDEEVGSVLKMTHKERVTLIKRTDELADEVGPVLDALANDSPLTIPKKQLLV